jgi:ABC-type antimicrobial peptide transport system permease subunit
MVRGRTFSAQDSENSNRVVVINETMAKRFFGDDDPIGQLLEININEGNPALEKDRPREVVGIVRDSRNQLRNDPQPVMYIPYQQHLWDYAGSGPFFLHARKSFAVKTTSDNPVSAQGMVREIFTTLDSAVALDNITSMDQRLADSAGDERFWMRFLSIFAGLAVFLAAMGIYGVISYSVEQRTREFGLRSALGASNADILKLVLREGFVVTVVGLAIGIGAAFGLTRFIANQLYGVTPMDPVTISLVSLVLVAIALLGCYIPGRRATKTSPLIALRTE